MKRFSGPKKIFPKKLKTDTVQTAFIPDDLLISVTVRFKMSPNVTVTRISYFTMMIFLDDYIS